MQNIKNMTVDKEERRLHPRIMAPARALVTVSEAFSSLPYNLADISEGGLAFLYLSDSPLPLNDSQMDIYLNEDLQISRLPVTVVSDHHLDDNFKIKRRCSVRFELLTHDQRKQLKTFIASHGPSGTSS